MRIQRNPICLPEMKFLDKYQLESYKIANCFTVVFFLNLIKHDKNSVILCNLTNRGVVTE